MLLFHIQFVSLILLLIFSTCVFGIIKLPICQCECCPGEYCSSELVVYSVDQCNETSCSFEQCYHMYPKKCGLLPGLTYSFCEFTQQITKNFSTTLSPISSSHHTYTRIFNIASMNIQCSLIFIVSFVFLSNFFVYMQFI